ncbi:hypothetical protein NDU88_011106 [Pleurodeles waltl]|uniref:Uncharacterized protein n=1 Tax=Pleurodeles waltl TaxID=8319 RepID=A0AAV7QWK8_PLEWA|nr:hypothetical protein NDU88_011106 [Pleurodeles waltl]
MGPGAAVTHQREGRKKQGGHRDLSSSFGALPGACLAVGFACEESPLSPSVLPGSQRGPGVTGPTRCLCGSPSFRAAFYAFGAPAILSAGRSVRFQLPLGPRTPGRRSDAPGAALTFRRLPFPPGRAVNARFLSG